MAFDEKKVKEANEKIADLIKKAYDLIAEAEVVAEEAGTGFSFELAYGMGGWYTSKKQKREDAGVSDDDEDWEPSDESGWTASSQSC